MESLAQQQTSGEIPNSLKYGRLPKKSISGSSKLRRFAPSNAGSHYDPANNNIIRIPITGSSNNTFLDGSHSYLELKISADNKTTNSAQILDGHISAVIQRLRILDRNSGQCLEDINNYNLLFATMFKLQTSADKLPHHNAVSGCPPSMLISGVNNGATDIVSCDYQQFDVSKSRQFAGNTSASDMTLCTPLISGFLSNTKGLYIPLGGSSIEIELTLSAPGACLVSGDDVNYKLKSVHFYAPIVTIEAPEFSQNMKQMISVMGGLSFTGSVYENFVSSNMTAGVGEKTIDIPIQCRSLRAILSVARTTTEVNDRAVYSLNKTNPNATTAFNYRIGNEMYPPSRIDCAIVDGDASNTSNSYQQLLMATGQLNSIHAQTLITNKAFNTDSWIYSIDTESYLNESGNISHTGLDLLNGNLNCSLEVANNPGANQRLDTFALKEVLFYLDANGSFSVSK